MGLVRRFLRKLAVMIWQQGVSLESASNRILHGVSDRILSEEEIGFERFTSSRNPLTGRVTRFHHPKPVIYELREITFSPALGYLGYQGRRILESAHPDDRATWAWDSSALPWPRVKDPGPATAMRIGTNYYHFLLEDLPRLILLRKSRGISTLFTGTTAVPPFAMEALGALKIQLKIIRIPRVFQKLCFVGPLDGLFQPSRLAVDLLGELWPTHSETSIAPWEKVYISRRFSKRSLPGEQELEDWISSRGFRVVFLETMSLRDQVSLFRVTKVVVGPHGAGLANIAFMPPGATVIELMLATYQNSVFETLAADRHRFTRILLREDTVTVGPVITELEAALRRAGVSL